MSYFATHPDWAARALPASPNALARWRPWFEPADERFGALVLGNSQLELLHTGMRWCEGPVYVPAWDVVVCSDIPNDQLLCWRVGVATVLRSPSRFANGNTLDGQGRLVSCEHGSRSVTRTEHDGRITVLADQVNGKRLNSPNDVVVARNGSVWFTDPSYGILSDYEGYAGESEYGGCWVLRVDEQGRVQVVADDFVKPNGLAFSPDEKTLYVADSARSHDPKGPAHVRALSLSDTGEVTASRVFAEVSPGVPDGLRVDAAGNVWISCGSGVVVHAPDGRLLGRLRTPEGVANLCFGGPSGSRLFIAATTSLYALDLAVAGNGLRGRQPPWAAPR